MQGMQRREVHVSTVHHIDSARFGSQQIQDVDVVQLAVGDMNEARDRPAQVKQRVHVHGYLGGAERCPRKHRQAQVNVVESRA